MAGPTTPNPVLWLKADVGVFSDAGVNPCTDGQLVQQWNDQSGNGNNAVQATSGKRFTYRATAGPNGMPYLQAVAASGTRMVAPLPTVTSPCTIAIVVKASQTDTASLGAQVLYQGADAAKNSLYIDYGALQWVCFGGSYVQSFVRPDSCVNVFVVRYNGASGSVRQNGVKLLTGDFGSAGFGTSLCVGSSGDDNFYIEGGEYEVLVYDSALSDGAVVDIESYLRRWQKSPNLTHYKLAMAPWTGSNLYTQDQEKLRMYSSEDGFDWLPWTTYYTPHTGSVRDPRLRYDSVTGYWFMCHTNSGFGPGQTTTIAKTLDFITWDWVTDVDWSDAQPSVNEAWSPKWFVETDGTIYQICSISSDGGVTFLSYIKTALTSDLTSWSASRLIAPQAGDSYDGGIVFPGIYDPTKYEFWFTNTVNRYIEIYSATSREGVYSSTKLGNWAGWGVNVEGVKIVVPTATTTLRAYMYLFSNPPVGYYYSESTDAGATWSAPAVVGNIIYASNGSPEELFVPGAALTGNALTISGGTVKSTITITLTGQTITSAQGVLKASLTIGLIGQSTILTTGTVTVPGDVVVALTGLSLVASTGTLGVLRTVALVGSQIVIDSGFVSPAITVRLFGSTLLFTTGVLTPQGGTPIDVVVVPGGRWERTAERFNRTWRIQLAQNPLLGPTNPLYAAVGDKRDYLFDFSRAPEIMQGLTIDSAEILGGSGLTIGSPVVTTEEEDGIPASQAVSVDITAGTPNSITALACKATLSNGRVLVIPAQLYVLPNY